MGNFDEAIGVDKVLAKMSDTNREQNVEAITHIVDDIEAARENAGELIPTGLLYGRIQSGKTRTMVLSAANAIDRGTKVIVVLTSNNNDLVEQTYDAFKKGLPGVKVISKSELQDMTSEVELLRTTLPRNEGSVVIICSKDPRLLQKVNQFLESINASQYPAIIFDDEGDQATLDTNVSKRSKTDSEVQPSRIYSLINGVDYDSLRNALPKAVFVSVTGTPQALFLQNSDSSMRPAFIRLTNPGSGYVGGEIFFNHPYPDSNPYISVVDEDEVSILLDEPERVPEGLKDAINYFIVAAAIAGIETGWRSYNMLAHPSLSRFDHALVKQKIVSYVNEILIIVSDPKHPKSTDLQSELRTIFGEIENRRGKGYSFSFDHLLETIRQKLPQRQLFVVNSDRSGPMQSPSMSYNFLIGGNSVGRGLAIQNLLVTYYTRSPRIAQMDTMHQHARMYGYRQDTLSYTKVFLPKSLYSRFYWINESDTSMRNFIKAKGSSLIDVIVPTNHRKGLRSTRRNVLDMNNVNVTLPGMQVHPGVAIYKAPLAARILKRTDKTLNAIGDNVKEQARSENGATISTAQAIDIVDSISFDASITRTTQSVIEYLDYLSTQYGETVRLRMRKSERRNNKYGNGTLPTGIMGGEEWSAAKSDTIPTLWIYKVTGKQAYDWAEDDFYYPTLVAPESEQSLYCNISA